MKLSKQTAQKLLFEAFLKHEGDRLAVAEELNMSIRTLYRELNRYEMHEILDKMGWQQTAGPPRAPRGDGHVRSQILKAIGKGRKHLQYGELAAQIYGESNIATRQRIFSHLNMMKRNGKIEKHPDGSWSVLVIV